jgi:RHS repeat-associated protein
VNGQGRAIAYTYDDLYRLTDEAIVDGVNGNRTSHYVYDAVGNRDSKTINGTTTTYAYDANDRLLTEKVGTATTVSYSYDNNGSTLTKVENGVTTTYTWNDEKRMVSATVGSTTTAEYVYNDQGIRVASKVNGVETRYLLDEGITANVWEEYAPNGTVQASYVYGRDLITQTQAGQTSYYWVDGLGSTRLLTDVQGQVLNAYGYEAFGQTVSQSGTISNKYQYAGEQFDVILGDYYLRQRFYNASSGRFGRMDTWEGKINRPITLSKYIYADANPVSYTDPSGYTTLGELVLTGAISGALFNVLSVAVTPGKHSWKRLAEAALIGALTGAVSGAIGAVSLPIAGAFSGASTTYLNFKFLGIKSDDNADIKTDIIVNAFIGMAGGILGKWTEIGGSQITGVIGTFAWTWAFSVAYSYVSSFGLILKELQPVKKKK